jgi:hypothetical protein
MNPQRVDTAKTDRTPDGASFLGIRRRSGLAS